MTYLLQQRLIADAVVCVIDIIQTSNIVRRYSLAEIINRVRVVSVSKLIFGSEACRVYMLSADNAYRSVKLLTLVHKCKLHLLIYSVITSGVM